MAGLLGDDALAALEEMREAAPVVEPQPAGTCSYNCDVRSQRSALVRRATRFVRGCALRWQEPTTAIVSIIEPAARAHRVQR